MREEWNLLSNERSDRETWVLGPTWWEMKGWLNWAIQEMDFQRYGMMKDPN
jgi:hypothetical protein